MVERIRSFIIVSLKEADLGLLGLLIRTPRRLKLLISEKEKGGLVLLEQLEEFLL